jgi:phosphoribosylamine--glycine ligase
VIKGLDRVSGEVLIFHAGTKQDGSRLIVDGGRVLNVVGTGPSLAAARSRAYEAVEVVSWPGAEFRMDIAG